MAADMDKGSPEANAGGLCVREEVHGGTHPVGEEFRLNLGALARNDKADRRKRERPASTRAFLYQLFLVL